MKRTVYFILVIVVAALATNLLKAEEWQKFTCQEGGFTALYPKEPAPTQYYDSTYKVTNYYFMTAVEDANGKPTVYATHYVPLSFDPSLLTSTKLRHDALQSFAEGQVESFDAKMGDKQFFEKDGYQVFEYSATFNDGSFSLKSIIYLLEDKFVSATVLMQPGVQNGDDTSKFLNALEIIKK